MRKLVFWRDVNLAIGAGGLAAVVAAVQLPAVGEGALQVMLIIAGAIGLLIGVVGTIVCWTVARTEAALRRGDGVMGRWRIDAAAWPGFLELEKRMAAPKITGTPLQATAIFAVLGGVFSFGAVTMVYGAWQMVTGRRNMPSRTG